MSARTTIISRLVLIALIPTLPAMAATTINTETLLDDMVDLQRLTRLPDPAYTTRQFSSHDRASKSPDENWFANADAGQYLRIEQVEGRHEHVMMDIDGPGAIVRMWSANPKGVLRIYLDGNPEPAIVDTMENLLGGRTPGLPMPLAGERSRGWNLYFPIAYAKHCKVTSDEGGFYYLINYRTYEPGTNVETFTPADLVQLRHKIYTTAARLMSPREDVPPPADRTKKMWDVSLEPGDEATIYENSGPKSIVGILTHIHAKDIEAAARSVVVYMTFDGEQTVECPIGDYYGTAPGLTSYASLPLGITEGSTPDMWSHWWMPFEKSAKIRLKNLGDQKVRLNGGVSAVDYDWDATSLHFNAGWRQQKDLPTRPMSDWTHLELTGTGRFVGGALHIQNFVRNWWGEGDEKIYVDGETFPSHFGTGTEDYYGYAWCSPERFVHAYHNQPRCDGPGNYGNTSVNRMHIIDDIPFTKSFKFDIENWHSGDTKVNRAAVSYWYARPGCSDFYQPITAEDVKLEAIPEFKVFKIEGGQEGEGLKVLETTGGSTRHQNLLGFHPNFSGCAHVWWTGGKPGDRATFEFTSPEAGRKQLVLHLTKARDYAVVQFHVNGKKVGGPVDLYAVNVVPSGPVDLGTCDLLKGANKLTVEIVGANEEADKSYMFGLDCVVVK